MKFYKIYPECPAGFEGVEWDESFDPPRQISAHLIFAAPVFAELITSYGGAFAVTEPLAEALAKSGLTGFQFGPLSGEISPDLSKDTPPFEIPALRGLVITGRALADDFGVKMLGLLILSERAVDFLTMRNESFGKYVYELS
ncbi:hypothetical protein OG225_07415 [Nocardia sp. NBC_01377]|uniref:hypothetical protein n=1 Tax=Nocardia sp. NBC_01377 TaxID=2903595 RepID=UPI00324F37FB